MRVLTERSGACLDLDVLRRLRTQSEHESTPCIVGKGLGRGEGDADLSEGVDALEGAEEALCHGVLKSKKPNKEKKAGEKEGAEGGLACLWCADDGGGEESCRKGRR